MIFFGHGFFVLLNPLKQIFDIMLALEFLEGVHIFFLKCLLVVMFSLIQNVVVHIGIVFRNPDDFRFLNTSDKFTHKGK